MNEMDGKLDGQDKGPGEQSGGQTAGQFGSADPQLVELVAARCDGTITAQDADRLDSLLRHDEQARLFYLAHLQVHGHLLWLHRGERDATGDGSMGTLKPAPMHPTQASPGRKSSAAERALRSGRSLRWLLSLAAALALVAGAVWRWDQLNQPVPAPTATTTTKTAPATVASLIHVDDARWGGTELAVGHRFRPGDTLRLDAGISELVFDNGAHLLAMGPAEIRIDSGEAVEVGRGTVWIEAPPSAYGFRVVTPQATLVDLGTEFGVDVGHDGGTELAVYSGLVECFPLNAGGVAVGRARLRTGQTVQINAGITTPVEQPSLRLEKISELERVEGVRAYWRFEEAVPPPMQEGLATQLGVISDSSGNRSRLDYWPGGNEGVGAYTPSTDVPPIGMFSRGRSGGYRSLDHGALDAMAAGVVSSNGFHGRAESVRGGFTVEGFFKTRGDQAQAGSMSLIYQGERYFTYIAGLNKGGGQGNFLGSIFGTINAKTTDIDVNLDQDNFADGRWHYFAMRYTAPVVDTNTPGILRVDVIDEDGKHVHGAKDVPANFLIAVSDRSLLLGRVRFYHGEEKKQHFVGLMDEMRLSSRVLKNEELLGKLPAK